MKNQTEIDIQQGLIKKISSLTGILEENISIHTPFAEYGLDSLLAVSLSSDIEDWLGVILEPTIAWDFPTIAEMALHLLEQIELNSAIQYKTTKSVEANEA